MTKILKDNQLLDTEWIEAIDGRNISEHDIEKYFDIKKFLKINRRYARPGEIGCVLSHRICYKLLLDSKENYALVLEDDVIIRKPLYEIKEVIENLMHSDNPTILLLSGWFWYLYKKRIHKNFELCRVYDGRLAQSYVINRKAAEILLSSKPYTLADDWGNIRKNSIKIYSLIPHLTEQNFKGPLKSYISNSRSPIIKGMWNSYFKEKINGIPRRLLKIIGKFYPQEGIK